MNAQRIGGWISAAVLACGILACSPSSRIASLDPTEAAPSSAPLASPAASASDAPPELRVTCDGTVTLIPIPRVRARADGIHVRFANPTGRMLEYSVDDASGLAMFGDSVPVGGGASVYALGTGLYQLGCGGAPATFAVVDPDGVYTSSELGCGNASGTIGTNDYGQDARGPRGSLLNVARMEVRGLQPGDLVERAGYPASVGERTVRVVRAGRVVAVIGYGDDGHGGWLIGTSRTCQGSGITVEAP